MSDAYDDSNPFGRSSPPARGGAQQAQQQDYRTTDDYLRQAIGNLVETEDMAGEALAHLAAQREMLDNMQNNVRRMDNTLDVADRKIAEMENPWAIGPVKVKSTGKHQGDLGGSGAGKVLSAAQQAASGDFQMSGEVWKRARLLKTWNTRYFRQVGDTIEYYNSKDDTKLRGQIVLTGATLNRISYNEKDSNGAVCNKDNCFEIIEAGQKKGDTIHVKASTDYNTWLTCIERRINPQRIKTQGANTYDANNNRGGAGSAAAPSRSSRPGVGFGNAAQDEMLDTIIDKLDNIDGLSRVIGDEVQDQTKTIQQLSTAMDGLDSRVVKNKERVNKIK